ncbi:MAG: hypothetical protein GXX95_02410 [Methanomassiliicoccus sp.]|jgi:hypothetical protein|nr:hypothetical protein [Methanomassiliicoccus sp.]
MDRDQVLSNVESKIKAIPGVLDMRFLDAELKKQVVESEQQAEKNGACGGLMPFINKGVWAALDREVSLVLVGSVDLLVDDRGLLYMMDQKGQVLGEYVTPTQREKLLKEKPETRFLSEDFILHGDIDIAGEPYFLINETHFEHLKDVEGIERVTSGSLSTLTDDLVREIMGFTGPKMWTHLVGFDLIK